jgi:hypothetical protein
MQTNPVLVAVAAAIAAFTIPILAQVDIPIEPVTVSQPVTVTQNVTVSQVPVQAIHFDLVNERIDFRVAGLAGGNSTITITGQQYQAIKTSFLAPFAAAVAPTLREKVAGE